MNNIKLQGINKIIETYEREQRRKERELAYQERIMEFKKNVKVNNNEQNHTV